MFQEYKDKIISFYQEYKRMPGYKEIMSMCGFKSKNAVFKLINKLIESGIVSKDKDGHIVPMVGLGELRMLGSVQAGFPSVEEEQELDTFNIDEYLVNDRSHTYMLTVKGDSMIDAGIHEGDMVIVQKTDKANPGDIVIACLDGEWTMKYLRKKKDQYYLEAANERYPDLHPSESFSIGGIVKGVLRKYQ